ncbi:MAG: metallophosphoesterase [Candidatus Zixiibacteriota bacterium]
MQVLRYIVITFIFALYLSLNYYVFWRLNGWFNTSLGWKFNIIGAALTIIALIFVVWHGNPYKVLHFIGAYWFGIMFIALSIVLITNFVALFWKIKPLYYGIFAISVTLILVIYSSINASIGRKLYKHTLKSPKINQKTRIALLADTHITGFHDDKLLSSIVDDIIDIDPDIVLIAGDFADGEAKYESIAPIDRVSAPVFLAMGNHDIWNNHNGKMEKMVDRTKIQILHNDTANFRDIQIIGFPYSDKRKMLDNSFKNQDLDSNKYRILLYHEPKEIAIAKKHGIDLMLSGHTHAGQIMPFTIAVRLAYPYFKGLYDYEGMKVYVSRGTSNWGPPMRLGSRNEITVIDLEPSK